MAPGLLRLQRAAAHSRAGRAIGKAQEGPCPVHLLPIAVRVGLPCPGPRPCLCTFSLGRKHTVPTATWAHTAACPRTEVLDPQTPTPLSQVSFFVPGGGGRDRHCVVQCIIFKLLCVCVGRRLHEVE